MEEKNLNEPIIQKDGNIVHAEEKKSRWKGRTRWQKISFILSIVIFALSVCFLITLLFARQLYGNEFANSLYGEGVPNGFIAIANTFMAKNIGMCILYSLTTIVVSFIVAFILDFIVKKIQF